MDKPQANMIKLPYEEMKFHYITNFYDYPLTGTCIYQGKIALFEASDETDYQLMNDTCPSCGPENKPDEFCHCQNAPDLFYYITVLPFGKRIYYRVQPYLSLLWYVRRYGLLGIKYWKRWYRGKYRI